MMGENRHGAWTQEKEKQIKEAEAKKIEEQGGKK